jgi:signal transduction histidine kinase
MISDIAHELRTPLGNIRGWLEAAEDGIVDPAEDLTSSLLEEALLLQHIIDDLRDLAAADAGQFRLHRAPTQLGELLRQVSRAQQAQAEAAGVRLETRFPGRADLTADADPERLRQAVGNLVSNAIRHTPPGGGVTVTCQRTGSEFIVQVADTGTGISPDDLPLIFERFWRGDKSRSRRTGGSGLGLPITRQLVEAHGGHLTAASTPGHGSVFTIWLPARQTADDGRDR